MKSYQKLQWLVVVLSLLIGLVGCDSGDGGLTTPANITVGSAGDASPANFWVGRGGNKFGIYKQDNSFQIQAPEGTYLLAYTIQGGGIFHIVFSAGEDGAFLAVGLLPGHMLADVTLYEGEIPGGVEPEIEKQGVKVYCFPGSTVNVTWQTVFKFSPVMVIIVLVADGEIVVGDPDIESLEPVRCTKTIETNVIGQTLVGTVNPPEEEAPCGSSRSFKIKVYDPAGFVPDPDGTAGGTVKDVSLNGVSVLNQVQVLGNGEGHLVIHNIQEDIKMLVELW
jgi:hypothetical protein